MIRPLHSVALAFSMLAFAAAPALADIEKERDDTIAGAYGPLASGTTYDGYFEDRGDETDPDYYKFVASEATATVALTNTTANCPDGAGGCSIGVRVVDAQNDLVAGGSDAYRPRILPGSGETITLFDLSPGTTYYVNVITVGACNTYSLTVTNTTGAPSGQGTYRSCAEAAAAAGASGGADAGGGGGDGGSGGSGGSGGDGSGDSGVVVGTCEKMATALADLDVQRDAQKKEYDAAVAAYRAAEEGTPKQAARAMMLREKGQLLDDLKRASDQIKAMRRAKCSCQLHERTIKRSRTDRSAAKKALRAAGSAREGLAQRRRLRKRVSVLTKRIAATQRAARRAKCASSRRA